MGLPDIHSRTHLRGGTDPLPIELPYAMATGGAQTIDTSAEFVVFNSFRTNDPGLFEVDPDNDGILVKGPGLYMTLARVDSGAATTSRNTYVEMQPAASMPVFGSEFGETSYAFDSSLLDDTNARQVHNAVAPVTGPTPAAPYKTVIVAKRNGTDYAISTSGLVVVRLSGYLFPTPL